MNSLWPTISVPPGATCTATGATSHTRAGWGISNRRYLGSFTPALTQAVRPIKSGILTYRPSTDLQSGRAVPGTPGPRTPARLHSRPDTGSKSRSPVVSIRSRAEAKVLLHKAVEGSSPVWVCRPMLVPDRVGSSPVEEHVKELVRSFRGWKAPSGAFVEVSCIAISLNPVRNHFLRQCDLGGIYVILAVRGKSLALVAAQREPEQPLLVVLASPANKGRTSMLGNEITLV